MPDILTDDELAAVLVAISDMQDRCTSNVPADLAEKAAHTDALLASAAAKLHAMHGLPTGPVA